MARKRGKDNVSSGGEPKYRLPLVFLSLFTLFVAFAGRLVQVQAFDGKWLAKEAIGQRLRTKELPPNRGAIYDRDGELLAASLDMETVIATPYQIKHPGELATKMAPILRIPRRQLYQKLTRKSGFEYVARKISKSTADRIRELGKGTKILEGITFSPESKRNYPGGNLAAQVIGFVNFENEAAAGLEARYDRYLRGTPGSLTMEQYRDGRPIPGGRYELKASTNGSQLVLTIDKKIQFKAQQALAAAVKKYKAKGGTAIVMNPNTGEIYAMASAPVFDLNRYSESKPQAQLNRAVSEAFEPGSTMKILTAAAAINEGVYKQDSHIQVPPNLRAGGYLIRDAHEHGPLDLTLADVVARSSNIGASLVGQRLGKERLYQYIERFGLNSPTGIDLPGESNGWVPPPDEWSGSSIATIPFGQGITATPLEMLKVMSVIANGGKQVRPFMVSKVLRPDGRTLTPGRKRLNEQVITAESAETMARMMEKVVESKEGTGGSAAVPGYRVAGKTGTATKIKGDGTGYYSGHYIASFAGFLPAQRPELAIVVAVDDPRGAIYGGVIAAPVFKEIAEFSLRRLEIQP